MAHFLSALVLLLFFTLAEAHGQRTFSEAQAIKAAPGKYYDSEKWTFSLGAYHYEIDRTGRAQRQRNSGRPLRFRLDLAGSNELVRVYYIEHKGDLLLLCEDQLGGDGSGFISRFSGTTLKQKWRTHIPAFNIANGLIEGDSAYLGAIGFAAKLDLDSGKFIWKHDDFYRKYRKEGAFNIFETPEIAGSEVVYVERRHTQDGKPNFITFNKTSGKVVSVKVN